MPRFLSSPGLWFWSLATLATGSLHFWFPETATQTGHDSYSVTADGTKAFYRLIADHPFNVAISRNRRALTGLLENLPTDVTLCVLGPERPPTTDESLSLMEWVRQGGALVYAFRGRKEQELSWLRVKYHPHPPNDESLTPSTPLASGKLAWWTDGRLESPQGRKLVENDGTLQAVQIPYGIGQVVVVASALPFSNQLLTYGDNGVLAVRLLEAAGSPEFVTFDESLNSSGKAQVVGILFDPLIRPITIQILLLMMLFGWMGMRRFGPRLPSAASPRQNIVEHTDMVGNLHWKSQNGRAVLKAYLRQLALLLNLKAFRGNEERVLEPIARRSHRTVAELRKELKEAFQTSRSAQVERRHAARLIRRLALIRRAAKANRE